MEIIVKRSELLQQFSQISPVWPNSFWDSLAAMVEAYNNLLKWKTRESYNFFQKMCNILRK